MDRQQQSSANLLDTHNTLVADVLTRFRNLMREATAHGDTENEPPNPDTVAVNGLTMQMEFEGLHSTVKELLALSRRLKELWVFGPPGTEDPGAAAQAAQVEQNVVRVAELLNAIEGKGMAALAERNEGTWKSEAKPAAEGSQARTGA